METRVRVPFPPACMRARFYRSPLRPGAHGQRRPDGQRGAATGGDRAVYSPNTRSTPIEFPILHSERVKRGARKVCLESDLAMLALGVRYTRSAGGLRYSSADMARFVLAQLGAADDAVRLSQQATGGGDHALAGFNWRISTSADGGRVLRTSGGTFGASSYVEIRPDVDYGIVLLTNRSGAEGALHELAEQAFQQTGVERGGKERPPVPVDDRAVGEELSH